MSRILRESAVSSSKTASTSYKHLRMESGLYKIIGVNPAADQKWSGYLRSMLAFSLVSVLFLYGLERLQHYLLLSLGMANVPPALAWNTAASFVTNTNWQNYSGESTMATWSRWAAWRCRTSWPPRSASW